ncbi:hypothetical protein PP178_12470 [Zeaxanthinibacter sp. PT1]|uniref:hypothetical protein n=1 Tax=Zeaxanthinibacter TaxID=561554 RepID=UPI00234A3767|nr:hypothetical protein [Zeaxanthinibacter sp. PT1]MDC6352369.1 hypothetical protein [Zeaxanthinibacter sp. PT1]
MNNKLFSFLPLTNHVVPPVGITGWAFNLSIINRLFFCLILSFFISNITQAQQSFYGFDSEDASLGFQTVEAINDRCNYSEVGQNAEAYDVVGRIVEEMGLTMYFKMSECPNMKNARAQIVKDEKGNNVPYIIYDKNFLDQLAQESSTDWAAIGVLAHEVGHLQSGHTINNRGSKPRWELEADRFLGFQLAKLGASLEQAQSTVSQTSEKGSSTHPPRAERLNAVEAGWLRYNKPDTRRIVLDEDTPDRDITAELVLDRFSKEIGGNKKLNAVKHIESRESIKEKSRSDMGRTGNREYTFQYLQNFKEVHITHEDAREEYKVYFKDSIQNDSLVWKFTDEDIKKWRSGVPPIGAGNLVQKEKYDFISSKNSPLKFFFDHLKLSSNPDLVLYRGRSYLDGQEYFSLELPTIKFDLGNPPRKGKRISVSVTNYYNTRTGLLSMIARRETISTYRGGRLKDEYSIIQERSLTEYKDFEGIKLPTVTTTKIIEERDGYPVNGGRQKYREITDLNISYQ